MGIIDAFSQNVLFNMFVYSIVLIGITITRLLNTDKKKKKNHLPKILIIFYLIILSIYLNLEFISSIFDFPEVIAHIGMAICAAGLTLGSICMFFGFKKIFNRKYVILASVFGIAEYIIFIFWGDSGLNLSLVKTIIDFIIPFFLYKLIVDSLMKMGDKR